MTNLAINCLKLQKVCIGNPTQSLLSLVTCLSLFGSGSGWFIGVLLGVEVCLVVLRHRGLWLGK